MCVCVHFTFYVVFPFLLFCVAICCSLFFFFYNALLFFFLSFGGECLTKTKKKPKLFRFVVLLLFLPTLLQPLLLLFSIVRFCVSVVVVGIVRLLQRRMHLDYCMYYVFFFLFTAEKENTLAVQKCVVFFLKVIKLYFFLLLLNINLFLLTRLLAFPY